jgi:hypothetical protein
MKSTLCSMIMIEIVLQHSQSYIDLCYPQGTYLNNLVLEIDRKVLNTFSTIIKQ